MRTKRERRCACADQARKRRSDEWISVTKAQSGANVNDLLGRFFRSGGRRRSEGGALCVWVGWERHEHARSKGAEVVESERNAALLHSACLLGRGYVGLFPIPPGRGVE